MSRPSFNSNRDSNPAQKKRIVNTGGLRLDARAVLNQRKSRN